MVIKLEKEDTVTKSGTSSFQKFEKENAEI
jgi:hypothetical protein